MGFVVIGDRGKRFSESNEYSKRINTNVCVCYPSRIRTSVWIELNLKLQTKKIRITGGIKRTENRRVMSLNIATNSFPSVNTNARIK